jgi:hypothetical protein
MVEPVRGLSDAWIAVVLTIICFLPGYRREAKMMEKIVGQAVAQKAREKPFFWLFVFIVAVLLFTPLMLGNRFMWLVLTSSTCALGQPVRGGMRKNQIRLVGILGRGTGPETGRRGPVEGNRCTWPRACAPSSCSAHASS